MPELRALALMGATGTGKSALAMQWAEQFGTSIISCDSMQLYCRLDIGTAKPTAVERARVPHFMVDCADIGEVYSAARWAEEVRAVIRSENAAGRRPLIVGGTGFYLRALLKGFADIPPEDEAVRARLLLLQQQHGTPHLHAMLDTVDPATAVRLAPNDTQRILRALSVQHSSGVALSEWQQRGSAAAPAIDCPVLVLELPREVLRQRLAERFEAMMAAGWLEEVRWLAEQTLPDTHPAKRAVGYRQLLAHLNGECTLDQAVQDGITATRRYAKRQQTWFRHQVAATIGDAASLSAEAERIFNP
jgi:tRNA dimethylallyltransferase